MRYDDTAKIVQRRSVLLRKGPVLRFVVFRLYTIREREEKFNGSDFYRLRASKRIIFSKSRSRVYAALRGRINCFYRLT